MTFAILLVAAFLYGMGAVAMFHSLRRKDEPESARCWICGRTFNDFKGLYYHHRAQHDDPMSAVLPTKDAPYRSKQ